MSNQNANYLDYLPDIFEYLPGTDKEESEFFKGFIKIFQEKFVEIEKEIIKFPENVLDPDSALEKFLPYIASWIALELPEGWDEPTRRRLIKQMMGIYRMRGRKKALERVLKIYLKAQVQSINEIAPHIFSITVNYPKYKPEEFHKILDDIGKVIEREKPAHTYFYWEAKVPTMQICKVTLDNNGKPLVKGHSQVGVDTFLGTDKNPSFPENTA